MSSLEAAVQPVFRGQENEVSGSSLEALVRWFVKTAVVINVSQPYRLLWDSERRHQVSAGIPPNVVVSLYRVPTADLNWQQGRLPLGFTEASSDTGQLSRLIELTHVCEIQVGNLVGTVVALPWRLSNAIVHAPGEVAWPAPAGGMIRLDALPTLPQAFEEITSLTTRASGFWR